MNKNEIIIEQLRGRLDELHGIDEILKDVPEADPEDIDVDFSFGLLSFLHDLMTYTQHVGAALSKSLRLDLVDLDKGKKKAQVGEDWGVEKILQHCTLDDNVLKMPNVQFNKKAYGVAKTWIEEAGGAWDKSRQGFTFPFNAERVFGILQSGKRCNLQQDYQFFATPDAVCDWLVTLAGGVSEDDIVCEPSAGTGSIVKAILRACPGKTVDCYELMPENMERLRRIPEAHIIGEDWLKSDGEAYTKIIANPPFSHNQDIDHVRKMFDRLKPEGTVAAIMSQHWLNASELKCVEFRQWLGEMNAVRFPIDAGTFKESNTGVATIAVVIKKRQ